MKKYKINILLFLVATLALTGCTSLTPVERLLKANDKMDSLDNYAMQMTFLVEAESNGMTFDVSVDADAKLDVKNDTTYMNMELGFFGMTSKVENYTVLKGETATSYTKEEDADLWTKSVSPVEESDNQEESIADIIDIVSNGSTVEEIESDDPDITHYKVTLDKEATKKLLNESGSLTDEDMVGDEDAVTGDLIVHIYLNKDNYITELSMDFTDIIDVTSDEDAGKLNKMEFNFKFSDFNEVGSVTIPQNIIDTAVEEE